MHRHTTAAEWLLRAVRSKMAGVPHLSLSVREVTTPVAVQSRSQTPALLLPPADPAGAKPRRDHRFLDRVSRHEVPKTPGKKISEKIYDPARASHCISGLIVRHPSGVGIVINAWSTGLRGYAPRPRGYGAGTPVGVHRLPLFTMN